ncbi:MAG TPA: glycosyltransferase [Patescibacteria group bacterium]
MKILQLCPYLYPALAYGGPAKVVWQLSQELAKHHQVTIYTSDSFNKHQRLIPSQLVTATNPKVLYFKNIWNSLAYNQRLFTHFALIGEYWKHRHTFDIVHIHDVFVLPQLITALVARIFRHKYFISPHGVLNTTRLEHKSFIKWLLFTLLVKPVLTGATTIVATSQAEADELRANGFAQVSVVPNGVIANQVQPTHQFQTVEQTNQPTLLYIGRLHPQKGLMELLQAIKEIKTPCLLLIAGPDDGIKERMIRYIEDHQLANKVKLLGLVNPAQKKELYQLADIFVYPSYNEGFSISILEALAEGLPVLITDGCHFPDVKTYHVGKIVSINNLAAELTQAIPQLLADKASLKLYSKNAKQLVAQKYSIEHMAQRISSLYEK